MHSMSGQFITCIGSMVGSNSKFLVTFVYAFNEAIDRVPLWDYISSFDSSSLPWALIGDFNCILSLDELTGGREHWTLDMQCLKIV